MGTKRRKVPEGRDSPREAPIWRGWAKEVQLPPSKESAAHSKMQLLYDFNLNVLTII